MKYLHPIILGFTFLFISIFAAFAGLIIGPFLLPFINREKEETLSADGSFLLRFGKFPRWLSIFQTPDEKLPGDLTQPETKSIYKKWGFYGCSFYWAFIRNRVAGLSWLAKEPASHHFVQIYGYQEQAIELNHLLDQITDYSHIWHYEKKLGPVKFVCGYEVFKINSNDGNSFYWACPTFTLKKV